jgi:hypothetical protein
MQKPSQLGERYCIAGSAAVTGLTTHHFLQQPDAQAVETITRN